MPEPTPTPKPGKKTAADILKDIGAGGGGEPELPAGEREIGGPGAGGAAQPLPASEDIRVIDENTVIIDGKTMTPAEARARYKNDPQTTSAIDRAINQFTSRTVTGRTTKDVTGTTTITGTERRYIDIPTPEEFLDDFQTGFSTYVRGLRRSGAIGVQAATWLMDNMEMFLGEYLGRLGEMAQRGEQVFKPTAVTGEVTPLGTRPGDVGVKRAAGETVTREAGTTRVGETTTGAEEQTIIGAGGEPEVQTLEAPRRAYTTTTAQDMAEVLRQDETTRVAMEEEVVARPKVGVVHTLPPVDFLGQQFPASSLNIIFQGRKGMRAAQTRVGGPTQARRL